MDKPLNEQNSAAIVIKLPENLLINNISEFYQQYPLPLSGKQNLIIDGSKTAKIDSAGLQLLLIYIKKSKDLGLSVTWHEIVSENIKKNAQLIGVSDSILLSKEG